MAVDLEREMAWLLAELERAYGERDLVALVECFSHQAEVTAFGTDAAEKCVGLEALERQFLTDWKAFDTGTLAHAWTAIGHSGDVAWAAAEIDAAFARGDDRWQGRVRSTTVAIAEDGRLRIVHWHVSAPAGIAGG